MLKTILFDHDDTDGAGCAIVFTLAHQHLKEDEMEIVHCSNYNIDDRVMETINSGKINRDTMICFSDICASREIFEKLVNEYGKVEVWDHHRTNFFVEGIVPGAIICPENKLGKLECGTSLMYQFFCANFKDQRGELFRGDNYNRELMGVLIDSIRSWDTYEFKETNNLRARHIQVLFFLMGMKRFCKRFVERILNPNSNSELITSDQMDIIDNKMELEQHVIDDITIDNIQLIDLNGLKAAFRYAGGGANVSELSNQFLTKYPEIDIFVSYYPPSGTFSFRTVRNDLDIGTIVAKPIGGGGHPKAAGATVSNEVKRQIIQTILEVIDPNVYVSDIKEMEDDE